MGEFLEELSQDNERMKREGRSEAEIAEYNDKAFARWNESTFMTLHLQGMVKEAVK